ncbi:MAG TPA: glycosyltransferase family 4 protein [Candidatus Absconditabacterales bacterium]|nr:glycosyltransferase family 4 protein [Candidatus Absconditabacterales bacterium]
MKSLHILFILDHFFPYIGGGEVLFWELTRGLVRSGHKVTVITSHFDQTLSKHETIEGVEVIRVGKNRIGFQLLGAIKAINYCKKYHIDIIHGTSFFGLIPAWIVKIRTRIITIVTIHEVYGKLRFQFLGGLGIINYLYEWFCINILTFDNYICVSNYTKNSLRLMYGIPDYKLKTVYNGIDYDFRNPTQVDDIQICGLRTQYELQNNIIGLYFGRMGVAKGMDDVIKSLPHIVKLIPNYKQIFITPKKQPHSLFGFKNSFSVQEINDLITSYGLTNNVLWLDVQNKEQLRIWIGLSDIVILPSRAEGFGFAVSEVCALGKPLVTTNVGSIPEVVYGKVNFVEPGNKEDITRKVVGAIKGKYQIIAPKSFLWGECIESILDVYKKVLGKND